MLLDYLNKITDGDHDVLASVDDVSLAIRTFVGSARAVIFTKEGINVFPVMPVKELVGFLESEESLSAVLCSDTFKTTDIRTVASTRVPVDASTLIEKKAFNAEVAEMLQRHLGRDLIIFSGETGTGKSTMIRAICNSKKIRAGSYPTRNNVCNVSAEEDVDKDCVIFSDVYCSDVLKSDISKFGPERIVTSLYYSRSETVMKMLESIDAQDLCAVLVEVKRDSATGLRYIDSVAEVSASHYRKWFARTSNLNDNAYKKY